MCVCNVILWPVSGTVVGTGNATLPYYLTDTTIFRKKIIEVNFMFFLCNFVLRHFSFWEEFTVNWLRSSCKIVVILLVYNQLDAQFFSSMFCFYSIHVSGSHVPTIRRIIVSMRHLVYVTLCRQPSGMQVRMKLVRPGWGGSTLE